jgi:D-sedoheptulose 7-phosphate isomerase
MSKLIIENIDNHLELLISHKEIITHKVLEISKVIEVALKAGNKVLLCGNGGSAADAQHIAAEFTGRFVKERMALAALALTTDTSALTAIGNDYGYENIFERQVQALGKSGDILLGISTSGNSLNVIKALDSGKKLGCITVSLTGNNGGKLAEISDINLNISSKVTARIQELHILVGHLLCTLIDEL